MSLFNKYFSLAHTPHAAIAEMRGLLVLLMGTPYKKLKNGFLRGVASVALLSLLCACGFTPVYKQTNYVDGTNTAIEDLAAIEVIAPHNLNGQHFKTTLEDLLNPTSKSVPVKYRLETNVTSSETALAIEQDRTITRYKVTVFVTYKLIETGTNKVLSQGSLKRDGGYDKVPSDYATYVSAEDSTKRLVKEIASDTKMRVTGAILKK